MPSSCYSLVTSVALNTLLTTSERFAGNERLNKPMQHI